jgi:hypothetical protein
MHVAKRMFQVFHTYVTSVHMCFSSISDVCYRCFNCFRCMLQGFHLDVAKIDLVLHLLQWDPPIVAACCSYWAPLWVTVWSHEANRRIRNAHPQARQVIRTHVDASGPKAKRTRAGIHVGKERCRGRGGQSNVGWSRLCEQIARTQQAPSDASASERTSEH